MGAVVSLDVPIAKLASPASVFLISVDVMLWAAGIGFGLALIAASAP